MLAIIDVTDADGVIVRPELLASAEAIHRELRPAIVADYTQKMARIFQQGGRMAVAVEDAHVVGLSVWRCYENTYDGLKFYCDDLVTSSGRRSKGVGRALIDHMSRRALSLGVETLTLSSGTQRIDAHRFYFRAGFVIPAFAFSKKLK